MSGRNSYCYIKKSTGKEKTNYSKDDTKGLSKLPITLLHFQNNKTGYIVNIQYSASIPSLRAQTTICNLPTSETSIATLHLDSRAKVSEPLRNDRRHQIWNALLRFGHSVPLFEKH